MVAKTTIDEFKYQTKIPRPYPSKSEENFLSKKVIGTSVLAASEFVTMEEK